MSEERFFHVDSGSIKGTAERLDSGFLKADSVLTRTGIFEYRNPDGTIRRELRIKDEVFNKDSMDSLKMVPLTHGHPAQVFVTPENAKDLQVGHVGETVRKDGLDLMGTLMVTDVNTIKSIDRGHKDISCGYSCNLDFTPGEYEGQRYDAIQRDIRYNHVAVGIPKGRAGNAKINLDENDAVSVQIYKEEALSMPDLKKVNLDGVEYEAEASVITALHTAQKRIDELETSAKADSEEKAKLEAKLDTAKTELEEAKNLDVSALVKERVKLIEVAKSNLDEAEHEKLDSMEELEIKKAVIVARQPKANLDGKDEVYISARFDSVMEMEVVESKAPEFKKPEGRTDSEDKRQAYIDSLQNAYKGDK